MKFIYPKNSLRQILIVILLFVSAETWAGLQEGIAAYAGNNFMVALKALTPLAEKGDAKAQYLLAIMYENGQGVAQSYEQAVSWFGKSAERGNDQAMLHLGGMYKSGNGVQADLVQAHKWYSLSAASGNEYARHEVETLEAKLAPKQIKQAKVLAKEWLVKHRKK